MTAITIGEAGRADGANPAGMAASTRSRVRDATSLLTVYLVLLLALPSELIFGPLGSAGTPATLAGLLLAVWWVSAKALPDSGIARGFQPIMVGVATYAIAVAVSYVLSYQRFLLASEVRSADRAMITLVSFAGVALLAADGIERWSRLDVLTRRIALIGSILGGLGVLQFFTGLDIVPLYQIPGLRPNSAFSLIGERSDFRRVAGTAAHPIEFGVLMAMLLPFVLHYALFARTSKERQWRWISVGLVGMSIMMSLSRSGIIGVGAAGLVILASWDWRRRINGIMNVVMFTIFMRLLVPGLIGTLRNLFLNIRSDTSYQARTERYPVAFGLAHEHPWFGRGVGTLLPENFYGIVPLDNQYLASAIEIGVVGLCAMILMMLIGFFTARGARRRLADPEARSLSLCIAASVLVCLVSFPTFDALGFPQVTGCLALMLGLAGAAWRLARTDPALA